MDTPHILSCLWSVSLGCQQEGCISRWVLKRFHHNEFDHSGARQADARSGKGLPKPFHVSADMDMCMSGRVHGLGVLMCNGYVHARACPCVGFADV